MCNFFKKTLGLFLFALGLGIMIAILLPYIGWVIFVGLALLILGLVWLWG